MGLARLARADSAEVAAEAAFEEESLRLASRLALLPFPPQDIYDSAMGAFCRTTHSVHNTQQPCPHSSSSPQDIYDSAMGASREYNVDLAGECLAVQTDTTLVNSVFHSSLPPFLPARIGFGDRSALSS